MFKDTDPETIDAFFKVRIVGVVICLIVVTGAAKLILGYNPFPLHSGSYTEFLEKRGETNEK